MSKHKTINMWVAMIDAGWLREEPRVVCIQVEVVETPKQYRINGPASDNDMSLAIRGCGYKRHVNKTGNTCLFHTRKEALVSLEAVLGKREQNDRRAHEASMEYLFLIGEALENESN